MPDPTPEETLMRGILEDPKNAASLLSHLVPGDLASLLDWSTIRLEPGSHLQGELARSCTDLLFSVGTTCGGTRIGLHLLVPHRPTSGR